MGLAQPALQGLARALQNVDRFFEENGDYFVVQPVIVVLTCDLIELCSGSPQLGDVQGLAACAADQPRGVGRQPLVQ